MTSTKTTHAFVEYADGVDDGGNHDEEEEGDDDDGVDVIDDGVGRDGGGSKLKVVAADSGRRCLQWQFRLI